MKAWGTTSVGRVRENNEDAFKIEISPDKKAVIAIVCDGMGGARAGQIASEMATLSFTESMIENSGFNLSGKKLEGVMREAIASANSEIYKLSHTDDRYAGMGTTLVAAMCRNSKVMIANVGDSRAYFINTDGISRITRDHSLVEDMVERGTITELEAQVHPNKNVITRAVGTERDIRTDFYTKELHSGEFILLCSDGLSNLVSEQEMLYEILLEKQEEGACERLVEIANSRGGYDNITAVLIAR